MKTLVRPLSLTLLVALVALLTGCGGGGAAAPSSGGSAVTSAGPTVTVTGRVSMPGADKSGVLVTLARAEGAQAAAIARMIRGEAPVDATLFESPSRAVAPEDVWYGITDADGAYAIPGVPLGNYFISARKGDVYVSPQKSLSLTEANRQTGVEPINFELTPAGSLRGRVLFSPDLSNKAGVFCYIEGTSHLATTDASGNYLIRGVAIVPPYTYRVTFMKPGFNQAVSSVVTLQTAGSEVTVPDVTLTFNMGSDYPQLTIAPSGLTPKYGNSYYFTSPTVTYTITVPNGAQAPLFMALPDLSQYGGVMPAPGVDASPERTAALRPLQQFATSFTLTFPAEATYPYLPIKFVTAQGESFELTIPGIYTYDKTAPRLYATNPVTVSDNVDAVNGVTDHFYGFQGRLFIRLDGYGDYQNPEAAEMWVSFDNFATGSYVPFDDEPNLTLPDTGTSFTISIRLRDNAGNVTTTTVPVTRHLPTGLVSGIDNVPTPRLPVTFSNVTNASSGLIDPLVRLVFDDTAFLPIPYNQVTYATVPASGRISGYTYTPPATGDDVISASHTFQGKPYTGQASITFIGLSALAVTAVSPAYVKYGYDTDLRSLFSNPRVTYTGGGQPVPVDPASLTFSASSGTISNGHLYRPAVPSGTATITVTYTEGASSVSDTFTVTAYTLSHLNITTIPSPLKFEAGLSADLYNHIAVTADYSNGDSGVPVDRAKITFTSGNNYPIASNGSDPNPSVYTPGAADSDNLTVTVTDGVPVPVTFSVAIVTLQSVTLTNPVGPQKVERGVAYDLTPVTLLATFSDGSVKSFTSDQLIFERAGSPLSGLAFTPPAAGVDQITVKLVLAGVERGASLAFDVRQAVELRPNEGPFRIVVGGTKILDVRGEVVYSDPAYNVAGVPFGVTVSAGNFDPSTRVFTAPATPGTVQITYAYTRPSGDSVTRTLDVDVVAKPLFTNVTVNALAGEPNPPTGYATIRWTLDQPAEVTVFWGIRSDPSPDPDLSVYDFSSPASGGRYTIYNLSDGTKYFYRLVAVNEFGLIGVSDEYSFTNEFAVPAPPVAFQPDPDHPTPGGTIAGNTDLPLYTFQVAPGAGEPVVIEEIVLDANGSTGFDYTKLRDLRLVRTADGVAVSIQTVFDGTLPQKRFRFKVNRQFNGGAIYKMTLRGRATETAGKTIQFAVAPLLAKIRGVNTGANVSANSTTSGAVLTVGAAGSFTPSLAVTSQVFGSYMAGSDEYFFAGVDIDPFTGSGNMRNDGAGNALIVQSPPNGTYVTPGGTFALFPDRTMGDWEFDPAYHPGLNVPGGFVAVAPNTPTTIHLVGVVSGNKVVLEVAVNGSPTVPLATDFTLVVNSIATY